MLRRRKFKRIMSWIITMCMTAGMIQAPITVMAAAYSPPDEQEVYQTEEVSAAETCSITIPTGDGFVVTPYPIDSAAAVEKGSDFQFQVAIDAEKGYTAATAVKANGTALTAQMLGDPAEPVYTIANVQEDQSITVEGVIKESYTVTFPAEQTGYQAEAAKDSTLPVESNGSYSFRIVLDENYDQSNPVVKTHEDVLLTPDEQGVYTIANITADLGVSVAGINENAETAKQKEVYLSDIEWKSAVNGKDAAGENPVPTLDGNHKGGTLTLLVDGQEKTFAKGIGTQTNSEITYDLSDKGYTSFQAYAGVDYSANSYVGGEGCDVKFSVYVDDVLKYETPEGSTDASKNAEKIEIPLTAENQTLKLVTNMVQLPNNDWGNWADAKFILPYPDLENLALNKTAATFKTATGEEDTASSARPPSMAVDGISDDYIHNYAEMGHDGDSTSYYLQIDLGNIYEISQINMWRYFDERQYNGTVIATSQTQDFANPTIVYNSDAENKHGFGAGTEALYAETAAGKGFLLAELTQARFVRVYMAGSNKGDTNHIVEVQVMGYSFEPKPYDANALENAPAYLDFPTYYQDEQSNIGENKEKLHVGGQVTHPDVIVMDEPWNGYKYWMVYTPNVMLTSQYEQPSIVASHDGLTWEEPEGIQNPIEAEPETKRYHNNDADLVYDPVNDRMMAFWKWDDDYSKEGEVGAEIRVRISYDGVHWGKPTDANGNIATTADTVANMDDDSKTGFITVIQADDRYNMQSPAFTYDEHREIFVMWANNAGDVGYSNGQNNFVEMMWSYDGLNWSERTPVKNFLGKNGSGQQLAPWHQDISYIPELKEYWGLSQCFAGSSPDGSVLYFTKSKDGVNWEPVGTKAILNAGENGTWDDFQIYRSTFYYDMTNAVNPEDGVFRVWYSALQKDTAGKQIIDSSGNLTITAGPSDTRIWRIGYTENEYIEVMKALTRDEDYVEPDFVPATSLTLSVDKRSIQPGETMQVNAAFAPTDASDQVVKFTSLNEDIATVDAMGVVTGVARGTATIEGITREGTKGSVVVTVGDIQKGEIRHVIDNDHPLYLENYYWSDDAPAKNGLNASQNYDDENRIDSPVKLWETVPDTLKENTVILLIAERSLNDTTAIKEWIQRNVALCNANQIPCAVQIANGETNAATTIPLSFWSTLAKENSYLVGFNAAEMYNRFAGDNRDYVIDVIQIGIENGVSMMWTDTNVFGTNGVIYDWLTKDTKLADMMRNNKEYISLITKESYGFGAPNTDALFKGMWLTDYCDNWGTASDWWHWQLDDNGSLFGGEDGGDGWKQCLTWPENMYTQDLVVTASQGATCFKSEAQWYSNASKGMRTPAYQYSLIPFLEKLVSGEVKIPTKAELLERTKAIVVGRENWNEFNYDKTYSNLYPKTAQYGIVPFVPGNCPNEALTGFELVVKENLGESGLKEALDKLYPMPKSEGTAFSENFGDTWYWMNTSEDKDVRQYSKFNTAINGSDSITIDSAPHNFAIVKESTDRFNLYLSNYRIDKSELWDGTSYPGGFSDQDCYDYVWEMCERMLADTNHDKEKRDTVITVKNAVEPKIELVTQSPADGSYVKDNYVRPFTYNMVQKEGTADEWEITVSHNGIVEMNIITGDADVEANSVALSADKVDVVRNRTSSVTAIVGPENAGNKQLTWTSADETIAVVDERGTILGLKEGKTTIRAAISEKVYAECEVNVIDLKVTDVNVSEKAVTLDAGSAAQVSASVVPEDNSDGTIVWSSTNEKVATVTQSGKITAVAPGTANIIAQSAYEAKGIVAVTVNPTEYRKAERTGMTATASSAFAGSNEGPAENVLDGDIGTWWHSNYNPVAAPPHWIAVDFGEVKTINGVGYLPRTGAANGTIFKYELYAILEDGTESLIRSGDWARDDKEKHEEFDAIEAKGIKIVAKDSESSVGGFGSAAEIYIYEPTEKLTPAQLAENIKDIAPIAPGDTQITIPEIKGYDISLTKSSNPDVIDLEGNITPENEDTDVTLTFEVGSQSAQKKFLFFTLSGDTATTEVVVTVPGGKKAVEATGITLNKTELFLKEGASETLKATVLPENADNKSVTWSSDNTAATVKDGVVTAVKKGTATITAATHNGLKAKCKVTVQKTEVKPEPEPTPEPTPEPGATLQKKGEWIANGTGWWYQYEDGSYPKQEWMEINGEWYYFGSNGYMQTGWQLLGNQWYYMDETRGNMTTGWLLAGGSWYYLNDNGSMATGWASVNNSWYYLTGNGAMATGWLELPSGWYYLNTDGSMVVDWLLDGDTWYFLREDGSLATGWTDVYGTWYYMTGNGSMATGWVRDGDTWYYLHDNGAMATGWIKYNNIWYYLNDSGSMATGWLLDGNIWYYLYSNGSMATGWIKDMKGNSYHLTQTGAWDGQMR